MFAEKPDDDDPQAQFADFGMLHHTVDVTEEGVAGAVDAWLANLAEQEKGGVKPSQPDTSERLSPTELAEMAHSEALNNTHKTDLNIVPTVGYALLTVGYPLDASIAQHETHLTIQHDYNMVLVGTKSVENPDGYHDYTVARYLNRDDYDDAVLNDIIGEFR